LRRLDAKIFQHPTADTVFVAVVGTQPFHYQDSLAGLVEYDMAIEDTAIGIYTHRIFPTPKWYILWNEDGYMRYGAKQGYADFSPTFSTANVNTDFIFHGNGVKANYTLLNTSAPDSLTWDWLVVADTTVWTGTLTKAKIAAWFDGKLLYPTAVDATGDSVGVIRTKTAGSVVNKTLAGTMTYWVQTAGASYPVVVDPSVNDTAEAAPRSGGLRGDNATYTTIRNSTTAASFADATYAIKYLGTYYIARRFLSFATGGLPSVTTVDSVRFKATRTQYANGAMAFYGIEGTFAGSEATGWFNDFTGWGASGAYTPVYYTERITSDADPVTALGTQALKDTLQSKMGSADTVRIAFLDSADIFSVTPTDSSQTKFTPAWLEIYYDGSPAGFTHTVAGISTPTSVAGVAAPSKVAGIE